MSEIVDTPMDPVTPDVVTPDGELVDAEVQFETLEPPTSTIAADGTDLGRVIDVPVELAVEIGRTTMTIGETLSLAPGSIVSLNRLAGEPVDLLVNGKVIAQGEVVVIDEEFGMRITDIVSAHQRLTDASTPDE
jgi:flagellar motor switch protein FliN